MPRGGWYKMFDDELDDPKIARLSDWEYRVWHAALSFCNRSPARDRERGYLYHSKSFPVEPMDFARQLGRPLDEVQGALERLCQVGGDASLIFTENGEGGQVYRVRAWRKRQTGAAGDESGDEIPNSSQSVPKISRQDVRRRRRRKTTTSADEKAAAADKQGAVDYFFHRLQEHTGLEKPEFPGGQAASFFTKRLKAGDTLEDLKETIDIFFTERIKGKKSAANFSLYQRSYNALCIALLERRKRATDYTGH